jgi:cell division protein ZapA
MSDDAIPVESGVSPVEIVVLGKRYRIACQESDHESLLKSAHYLDRKMREIRETGRVIGQDRIAVIAALDIAHELIQTQKQVNEPFRDFRKSLIALEDKIDGALDHSDVQEES